MKGAAILAEGGAYKRKGSNKVRTAKPCPPKIACSALLLDPTTPYCPTSIIEAKMVGVGSKSEDYFDQAIEAVNGEREEFKQFLKKKNKDVLDKWFYHKDDLGS